MGNKKMDNISTVKVNAYEIAKAPDIDFGYKSILDHFSILVDRLFNYHTPEITDKLFFDSELIGKDRKDFVIGGGLVAAGDAMLRPLPMVAFSNIGGIFITNGLNVDNRPFQIPIGEDFTVEGYRIESIYIGNADTNESIYGTGSGEKAKTDPNWDAYESEWRAAYQVGRGGIDTPFREFKKRQMQAVRFYVYPGVVELEKKNAIAAATPTGNDVFTRRVKIAEVLVHCVLDSGNVPHIQPIKPDDIRFVTAVQYWEDNEQKEPEQEDSAWTQYVSKAQPNIHSGMTYEQKKAEEERAAAETANRYAFRAEHYNYRWTADRTRTYRLGSVSEISERLYKIHKTDGTLKEEVVRRKHIFLRAEHEESLTGADIAIDHSARPPIELPYNRKIKEDISIKKGLLQLAENLRGDWIPVAGKDEKPVTLPYNRTIPAEKSVKEGLQALSASLRGGLIPIDNDNMPSVTLPYGKTLPPSLTVKQGLQALSDNLRSDRIPVAGTDIYMPYVADIKSSESIHTGLERISQVMSKNRERIDNEEKVRANADANHAALTQPHGATSSAAAERLAWRDSAGRMEVQDPVSDLQVVNIHYLNSTFKMDVVMKVLMSKLITTQSEFDKWIDQKHNEAYTYVYLKGSFTANHSINLGDIGTKEVTSVGSTSISLVTWGQSVDFESGIYGANGASVTGVTLTVKGKCIETNRIIGFQLCNCYNCTANVTGFDGKPGAPDYGPDSDSDNNKGSDHPGGNGNNGTMAVGFHSCYLHRCSAIVVGGDGGRGGQGANASAWVPVDYSSSSGGDGGAGGAAYSGYACSLSNEGFVQQNVSGGQGGRFGMCGTPKYGGWDGYAGSLGKNGKGGDVYAYKAFPHNVMPGGSHGGYKVWYGEPGKKGYHERSTLGGEIGSVYYL